MRNTFFCKALALALSAFLVGGGTVLPPFSCVPIRADNATQGPDDSSATEDPPAARSLPSAPTPATTDDGTVSGDGRPPSSRLAARRPPVPPANPLVLPSPLTGTGNPTVFYDVNGRPKRDQSAQDEADYTQPQARRLAAKPLPLFGYDFFQSARRIIEARRSYLQRLYGLTPPSGRLVPANGLDRPRVPPPSDAAGHVRASLPDGNDQSDKEIEARRQELAPATARARMSSPRRNAVGASGRRPDDGSQSDTGPSQAPTDDAAAPNRPRPGRGPDGDGTDQNPATAPDAMPGDAGLDDATGDGSGMGVPPDRAYDSSMLPLGAADSMGDDYGSAASPNPDVLPNDLPGDSTDQYDVPSAQDGQTMPNGMRLPANSRARRTERATPADGTTPGYGTTPGDGMTPGRDEGSGPDLDATTRTPPASDLGPVDAYREVADPLSELYRNVNATVPATYQLSAGDAVTVRYWSPTMEPRQATVRVDAQDAITVPGVGRLVVRGLTASGAEQALRARLRRLYNNADVTVTLQEPRTIPVTVSGAAFAPGTYEVPAVSTAFNVLYAAGGPTADGSLRAVEVRRAGRLVGTLDVYKLLLGVGKFADIPLQAGDLVVVTPCLSRVTVKGEVRQPAIYELTDHETLHDALRFARGVKPSGVTQHVEVATLQPGAARVLKDVNVADAARAVLPLYDGDVVDVFSVRATVTNRVTVGGAVDQPGDYALAPGMRVSDLLERARGPLPGAYTTRADLYRWNPDNTTTLIPVNVDRALARDPDADLPLVRWDRLQLYTRRQIAWTGLRQVTVRGAVQRPGVYTRSDNMHARDLLLQAGGPTPEGALGHVVLLHQHADGSFKYDYVDLSADSSADPLLQDNDVLALYTTQQAMFNADHIVTILGAVVAPGPYPRGSGMRLGDLLTLAGGLRPGAATRVGIAHAYKAGGDPAARPVTVALDGGGSDVPLQDGDVVTVQGTGGFQDQVRVVMVTGAVNRPGPLILTDKMRLSDAIAQAGGLRDVAYPLGAAFTRQSGMLANGEQRSLAQVISRLNDMLNQSQYKRELAKSDVERIQAAQDATQNNTSLLPLGSTNNSAAPNPAAAALATQLSQHDLVSAPRVLLPGDLQPSGNLAVNLAGALRRPGGPDDIALMDRDAIIVPERPTTVQVVGAVFNARGVMYREGASIGYYISQAGGLAPDAAGDRIEIIHAGGGLIPADKARGLEPGDLILVPTKVLAEKISRSGNGFTDFFTGLAGTAIVIKVVGSLFGL